MRTTATDIGVVALPTVFGPRNRVAVRVQPGTTLAEMVDQTVPQLKGPARARSHLTVNGHVIPSELWGKVKPKAGTHVIIQVVPGESSTLRSVLTIVVAIAAVAAGQFYGPGLASALMITGDIGTAIASASIIPGATIELDALGQGRDIEAAAS